MKRRALVQHLEAHGCQLIREGAKHSVYAHRGARKVPTVPCHVEIDDYLARKICRDLGVSMPSTVGRSPCGWGAPAREFRALRWLTEMFSATGQLDGKAELPQERSEAVPVVALDLDRAFLDRPPGAACALQGPRQLLALGGTAGDAGNEGDDFPMPATPLPRYPHDTIAYGLRRSRFAPTGVSSTAAARAAVEAPSVS
jgi:mRNA interferase HicA